ncbi:putative Centrosomal protein of 164 kDa [Hypsibius exemplaris]|uniref:Centrosomal protein of 164 kDa n=1 Tax=Hypsibius exemplaris TaxID=2072580 RepID=A0A1W0WMR6_HYPEX|nr:putative Centrosomal protein of 164 kDa [Hypsibius exemplaris]
MKSARPQILLQEDIAGENGPAQPPEPLEDDDIAEYARALGINAKNDEDLLWIAREGLNAALPPEWRAIEDQPSGQIYYFNVENGTAAWEHPMDSHYRLVVEQERQKRLRKTCVEEPALAAAAAATTDGSPGRPKSPYSVFRQQTPFGPRMERPTLRPRTPNNSRSPTGLASPPPWAKTSLSRPPSPSPPRTPSASPGESRKSTPSVESDGLIMKSPDTSSAGSAPFQADEKPPIGRKLSADKKASVTPSPTPECLPPGRKYSADKKDLAPPASVVVPATATASTVPALPIPVPAPVPTVQPINHEKLKEEEARIRKENEMALERIRDQLAKERLEEENKLRMKMAEELRVMKEKLAKDKEMGEKDLRQKSAEELKRVQDHLLRERESQERSIREAVQTDLKKLKEQLEVERMTQERTLRNAEAAKLKDAEEIVLKLTKEQLEKQEKENAQQKKELDELRRSMEQEIAEIQSVHKKRVEDLRRSHEDELEEIERNIVRLRRELEKLEMTVADEAAIKQKQIEALERQKASLEKHLSDLRKQELDIRAQCDNLTDELKQLTKDSKLNERAMVRLEQQRTDMEEDLYMLKRAKQRYVDRVEQLKLVVGENLFPGSSALDDEAPEAPEEIVPQNGSDDAVADEGDDATPLPGAAPSIEVIPSPPLENGVATPPTIPLVGEPNHNSRHLHFDSDDLLSNPSRPLTPEPTAGGSRPFSPMGGSSFFRRLSSNRSDEQSPGGNNGSPSSWSSSNPILFRTNPVSGSSPLQDIIHDLLMDESVCSDVTLPSLMSLFLATTAAAAAATTTTAVPTSVKTEASGRHDLQQLRSSWLTPVHYDPGMKLHHRQSAPGLGRSEARPVRVESSSQSPAYDPEKIASRTKPLNEYHLNRSFTDPASFGLTSQLDAIKTWIARQNARSLDLVGEVLLEEDRYMRDGAACAD